MYKDHYQDLMSKDSEFIKKLVQVGAIESVPPTTGVITLCTLETENTNNTQGVTFAGGRVLGVSYCSVDDKFFPLEGRYLSLGRALDHLRSMGVKEKSISLLVTRYEGWGKRVAAIQAKAVARDAVKAAKLAEKAEKAELIADLDLAQDSV